MSPAHHVSIIECVLQEDQVNMLRVNKLVLQAWFQAMHSTAVLGPGTVQVRCLGMSVLPEHLSCARLNAAVISH